MKTLFIEASATIDPAIPQDVLDRLPQKVALFTTIQYIKYLPDFRAQLERAGKGVALLETKHTRHPGQLLGCNLERYEGGFDAFLYVGDGLFHPKALVFHNAKPVYAFNPHTGQCTTVTAEMVRGLEKRRQAALAAFFAATEVGVLVTTKFGQHPIQADLDGITRLKEEFPDKRFTFLLADTLDFSALEDFAFVEVFVNTACPRLGFDDAPRAFRPVLNLTDLRGRPSGLEPSRPPAPPP